MEVSLMESEEIDSEVPNWFMLPCTLTHLLRKYFVSVCMRVFDRVFVVRRTFCVHN